MGVFKRESALNAEHLISHKSQIKLIQQKLIPKVERILTLNLQYIQRTLHKEQAVMGEIIPADMIVANVVPI